MTIQLFPPMYAFHHLRFLPITTPTCYFFSRPPFLRPVSNNDHPLLHIESRIQRKEGYQGRKVGRKDGRTDGRTDGR